MRRGKEIKRLHSFGELTKTAIKLNKEENKNEDGEDEGEEAR